MHTQHFANNIHYDRYHPSFVTVSSKMQKLRICDAAMHELTCFGILILMCGFELYHTCLWCFLKYLHSLRLQYLEYKSKNWNKKDIAAHIFNHLTLTTTTNLAKIICICFFFSLIPSCGLFYCQHFSFYSFTYTTHVQNHVEVQNKIINESNINDIQLQTERYCMRWERARERERDNDHINVNGKQNHYYSAFNYPGIHVELSYYGVCINIDTLSQ